MIGSTTSQLGALAAAILRHSAADGVHGALLSTRTAHDGRYSHAEVHPADLPWVERRPTC